MFGVKFPTFSAPDRRVRNQWGAVAPKMAAHHCAVSRTGVKPETAFSWRRASKLLRCRVVFALYRMPSVCESSTRVSIEVAYVPDASPVCQLVATPVWSALYSKAGDEWFSSLIPRVTYG